MDDRFLITTAGNLVCDTQDLPRRRAVKRPSQMFITEDEDPLLRYEELPEVIRMLRMKDRKQVLAFLFSADLQTTSFRCWVVAFIIAILLTLLPNAYLRFWLDANGNKPTYYSSLVGLYVSSIVVFYFMLRHFFLNLISNTNSRLYDSTFSAIV
ncbi:hypothetical protein VHEMI03139 [[Torrubiella] hemipterigena]|uniref:Uncharacterized protein n=1 Tax=[Torrubiella] hemipterigena TaxID=1531966 RepID=A0A0A1TA08_9HYPO|nr:hypothetical protein VHEMI03139 [[Torrubiella] hemipterigena]